ncbi:myb-like DNA-binding domain protein [Senna tora]|uniref:Myb-like DNA-binding domain protein n=1 Tax=Senna tora TaxID=362788 RepID=A0A834WVY0_9FABA|nr:myb-like DNA-binding domain protein [Senna tora]
MKRKSLHGDRAAPESSRKPYLSTTVRAIPLHVTTQDKDHAGVSKTSTEGNHVQRNVREVSPKDNVDNGIDEGGNRSPLDSLGHEYICVGLLDRKICISCNEGGEVLVCSERDCPVVLHAKCIRCEPKFDDRGNFYCSYCWFKRALVEVQELRNKALIAKKNLLNFLDKNVIASNKLAQKFEEAKRKEPKELSNGSCRGAQESVAISEDNECRMRDREKVLQNELEVPEISSSVSETNDSGSEAQSVKKKRIKHRAQKYPQRDSSVSKSLPLNRNTEGQNVCHQNEEVTSSRTLRQALVPFKQGCSKELTTPTGYRRRLRWTAEEEKVLKEGVLRFSAENYHQIPWRKILEFGCHVFDDTRTPGDLKDKWRNVIAKEVVLGF